MLVVALAVSSQGCSALTDVEAPDVVQPPDLRNPIGAQALRAGAIGSFIDAFAGGQVFTGSQVVRSGTIADEFIATNLIDEADKRILPDFGFGFFIYQPLQQTRLYLGDAIEALRRYVPTATAQVGQLFALRGYVILFFGENMCSGVPLSTVDDGALVFGRGLTTTELLNGAVQEFDSAITYAADSAKYLNLARVGKARALLSLARFADAVTAATPVPTTFSYLTEQSSTVQQNGIYVRTYVNRAGSVADREGTNGLDFISANDPRVVTQLIGPSSDPTVLTYGVTKYNSFASPVVLASGLEARLIEAEAAYQANPDDTASVGTGWLGILNSLRQTQISPPLAPLADPGSRTAREDLIFRERAFWLFGTGHRHGDLRRLIRQYGRSAESVFPTGPYRAGIVYGTDVTLTTTPDERNNPNYTGCIDRNP